MRPRRLNPESLITKGIRHFLAINQIYHWKNWGGPLSVKGVADLLGILPDGRFLGIEVKTPTGKLSAEQKEFIETIVQNGGIAFMATSVEEVRDKLIAYGVELKFPMKGSL